LRSAHWESTPGYQFPRLPVLRCAQPVSARFCCAHRDRGRRHRRQHPGGVCIQKSGAGLAKLPKLIIGDLLRQREIPERGTLLLSGSEHPFRQNPEDRSGVHADAEMNWREYAYAMLGFSAITLVLTYAGHHCRGAHLLPGVEPGTDPRTFAASVWKDVFSSRWAPCGFPGGGSVGV
jgi:hypothetical protein